MQYGLVYTQSFEEKKKFFYSFQTEYKLSDGSVEIPSKKIKKI